MAKLARSIAHLDLRADPRHRSSSRRLHWRGTHRTDQRPAGYRQSHGELERLWRAGSAFVGCAAHPPIAVPISVATAKIRLFRWRPAYVT